MSYSSVTCGVFGTLLAVLLALPLAASADDVLPFSNLEIAEPQRHFSATQECVEPEEEMRRNHMEYILHQRDKTMHEGIRTKKYSLNECVACHASAKTGSVLGEKGFCQSCHAYASVRIDCFSCHASKPKPASGTTP